MVYEYDREKQELFTDEGQRKFLKVRDKVFGLLNKSGAFSIDKIIDVGDSWFYIACVDRMAELREIVEVTVGFDNRRGFARSIQDRVFVKR